jgi:small acid-soluble spore protein F (minor alpha/beta-type SASP)
MLTWGGGRLGKIMSDATKIKLGERLGVDDIVRREGWGGVPARQCGNLVKEALKLAEEQLKS